MIDDLQKRLDELIDLLPPIPAVMTELLQALGDNDVELRTLADIISKDPLMSMNVLKVSNSAFYRLPNKVATVDHAVKLLGIKEIMGICIACGAYQSLKPPAHVETFDLHDFWRHSVIVGLISRNMCQNLEILDHNVLYFLGLLHDVGKVILDRVAHDVYKTIVQKTREENISVREAELILIGQSHDAVGGWLMEKWRLPPLFTSVARYHHFVSDSPDNDKAAIAIVSVADRLAWLRYLGLDAGLDAQSLAGPEAYSVLEQITTVEDMDFVALMDDIDGANEEIDEMINILNG